MNILFLALDVNLAYRTGDSIHVRELAQSLAGTGNKVLLITYDPGEQRDMEWAQNSSNLELYFTTSGRGLSDLSTVRFCKKVAKERNANIIYERRTSPKVGYALHKLLKIPYAVEINAIVEEEKALLSDRDNASFKGFRKNMRTRFFQEAALVVAVTPGIKEHIHVLYDVPKERIEVVPNGANTELFKPMNREQCIKSLNLEDDKKYICFIGNLAPWQGLIHMVDAMPQILKERENTVFLVVGGGKEREALEKRTRELNLEDSILFAGWVDYEKVPIYINACDVCVAPLAEGRGKSGSSAIKIYEYLACGKPVVASNVPYLDFLEKEGCGLLVPKGDESSLAQAVLSLLGDPERIKNMGTAGRAYVVEKGSWTGTAKRIDELLGNIIGQAK
jgi:glycosyltransferase involved in cell wall biosynthesis